MKKINLKKDHLQIYKRENSNFWQIKIKLPNEKSKRITSGTKILEEAKNIANKIYDENNKYNKNSLTIKKKYSYKSYHLIESKGLKKHEIESGKQSILIVWSFIP